MGTRPLGASMFVGYCLEFQAGAQVVEAAIESVRRGFRVLRADELRVRISARILIEQIFCAEGNGRRLHKRQVQEGVREFRIHQETVTGSDRQVTPHMIFEKAVVVVQPCQEPPRTPGVVGHE